MQSKPNRSLPVSQSSPSRSAQPSTARRARPHPPPLNREEKALLTYRNLMEAAARIVGEHGYAGTTIAKVTRAAGVAHGTFYNYFADQQELFDILLPYVGERMTDKITADLANGPAFGVEREVARFRSYCDYLRENPAFYRVLYEAEVFAPKAHAAHIGRLTDGYVRAMQRAIADGEMRERSEEALRTIAGALLGARAYIAMQYKDTGDIPDAAVEAYAGLIRNGLFGEHA
jgi:AcrR family transcriptional regulator